MREADEAFTWQVVDHDPVAYEAVNRMATKDFLSLCVAYLRRVKQSIQATKRARHGRAH